MSDARVTYAGMLRTALSMSAFTAARLAASVSTVGCGIDA
jgi:hypothetical protein